MRVKRHNHRESVVNEFDWLSWQISQYRLGIGISVGIIISHTYLPAWFARRASKLWSVVLLLALNNRIISNHIHPSNSWMGKEPQDLTDVMCLGASDPPGVRHQQTGSFRAGVYRYEQVGRPLDLASLKRCCDRLGDWSGHFKFLGTHAAIWWNFTFERSSRIYNFQYTILYNWLFNYLYNYIYKHNFMIWFYDLIWYDLVIWAIWVCFSAYRLLDSAIMWWVNSAWFTCGTSQLLSSSFCHVMSSNVDKDSFTQLSNVPLYVFSLFCFLYALSTVHIILLTHHLLYCNCILDNAIQAIHWLFQQTWYDFHSVGFCKCSI